MIHKNLRRQLFSVLFSIVLFAVSIAAQTTEFTYQGKLSDSGTPSATYDFEFRLCDSLAADCSAPLALQQVSGVPVTSGVFTVRLNFGAGAFNGSNRWLEIAVKRPAQAEYTRLNPRQPLTSAPYAIRSLNAGTADNSTLFGGLTVDGFVQNTTTQQTGNFNLSGNGTLGGTLLAETVGIGTTPFAGVKLDVNGAMLIRTPGLGGNIQFGTPSGQTGMTIIKTNRADIRFDDSTLKLLAGPGTGVMADTNGITVNTLGNVGIGTNSPGSKLDVAGNVFTSGFLSVGNGAGITGSLSVSNGITASNGLSVNSGNLNVTNGATISGNANIGNGLNVSNGLAVNSGGLSVVGTSNFTTVLLSLAAGTPDTDLCRNAGSRAVVSCASSLRYKSNVQTFQGGLNILNRLRPISFTWNSNGQRDIGFGAEEVFQIAPLLTTRNDAGGIEGVKYKLFSVIFVNAIKEQQTQIERQQKQIERQQQQIDALTRLVCSQNPQAGICKEQ